MTFRMKVYISGSKLNFDGVVKTPIYCALVPVQTFYETINFKRILHGAVYCFLLITLFSCSTMTQKNRPAKAGSGHRSFEAGQQALATGDVETAIKLMESACGRENFISVSDWYKALNTLGRLYFNTGKFNQGVSLLKNAEKYEWLSHDNAVYIDFLNLYGSLLSANRECAESTERHQKALSLSRQLNAAGQISDSWANLGISYSKCKDYPSAAEAFRNGLRFYKSGDPPRGSNVPEQSEIKKARIMLNLLSALSASGNYKSAAEFLIKNRFWPTRIQSKTEASDFLLSYAETAYKTAQKCPLKLKRILAKKVLRQLSDARKSFKNSHSILAEIEGTRGRFYLLTKNSTKALACFRRAVFLSGQENNPQVQYYWQWQLAELFSRAGKREPAINAYKKAVNKLTPIRSALLTIAGHSAHERKLFYHEKIKPVYSGLAALLLKTADDETDQIEKTTLILEARNIMDQLKNYELQDYFNDECIVCLPDQQESSQKVLKNTAIIYPLMFKKSLSLILTLPSGIKHIKVNITEETLSTIARRFRQRLQTGRGNRFKFYGKQLYSHLISPVEAYLKEETIDTLVIVPEGPLRLVPWAAFYNGTTYLAQSYATTIIPSLSAGLKESNGKPEGNVLLCGLSENENGIVILPNVPDELNELKKITNGTILLNNDFTGEKLKETLKADDYSIVHLATHGWFGDDSNDILLETFGGEMTMKTLESLISIGRFRKNRVSLLTISACDSGIGDERAAMGLGGLALRSGAESAVVTLWSISDKAASELFTDFYYNLTQKNQPKAKALQESHIRMINSKNFNHPAYWSTFLLVGDWL